MCDYRNRIQSLVLLLRLLAKKKTMLGKLALNGKTATLKLRPDFFDSDNRVTLRKPVIHLFDSGSGRPNVV
jgi:hypothetical protein